MSKPIYFQLEPAAFLSDVEFQAMTAEERGVYFTVILYLYTNSGILNMDDEAIGTLCRVSDLGIGWVNIWEKVKKKFTKTEFGYIHKRVTKELEKSKRNMQMSVESGLKGAKKRWGGHSNPIAKDHSPPIAKIREDKIREKEVGSDFELFWKLYPNKKSKASAKKAWLKIIIQTY